MTLGLKQKDLSERNSAAILESVLLGSIANLLWVRVCSRTGSVPVQASYIHLIQDLLGSRTWASLPTSTAKGTEKKMEQRTRLRQNPSLFIKTLHVLTRCGAFLSHSLRKGKKPCFDCQSLPCICFYCKLQWKCSVKSMTGEVGRGERRAHKCEAQGHKGIMVFVLSKGCASGVRRKGKGW